MRKKTVAVLMAVMMLIGVASGATIAWLATKTDGLTNTFTVGNINIKLEETVDTDFHVVPGDKMAKDPVVTVIKDSEDAYVFLRMVVDNNDFDSVTKLINWTMADGWTYIKNMETAEVDTTKTDFTTDGTYYFYRPYTTTDKDVPYYAIAGEGDKDMKNGFVTVNTGITKEMVDHADWEAPTIAFKAAAVQSQNLAEGENPLLNVIEQLPDEFYPGN